MILALSGCLTAFGLGCGSAAVQQRGAAVTAITATAAQEPAPATPAAPTISSPHRDAAPAPSESQESRYATLRIAPEVVSHCPELRTMRVPVGEESDTWLYTLKTMAECMTTGKMRHERVALGGGEDPQQVVAYVLTRLGVDQGRIEHLEAADAQKLECRIALAKRGTTVHAPSDIGSLAVSVDPRRVVAMAARDELSLE